MKTHSINPKQYLWRGGLLALLLALAVLLTWPTMGAVQAQEPLKKDPSACAAGEICAQASNLLTLSPPGPTFPDGSLLIYVYQEGTMDVGRYVSNTPISQVYGSSMGASSKGSKLYINGTSYNMGYSAYGGTQLPVTSHTQSGSQIISGWKPAANTFIVTQTVTYNSLNQFYQLQWDIVNISGSSLSDLRFFHGEDTYLKGGDSGAGFWEAGTNSIGVQKNVSGELQRMTLQGTTPPYAHCSAEYSSCASQAGANTLQNTIDPNENTDNGYALEWLKALLGPGETWRIVAYEKFVAGNVGAVTVAAPINTDCQIGQPCTLTYKVTNISGAAANVSLSLSGTQSWGQVITSPPSPVSISAGATRDVVVTLTVPNGTAEGATGEFTLNANDGSVTASDKGTVTAVSPHTLTVFKTGAGSGTITSSGAAYINCGADCTESFAPNDSASVTLVATPGAYSVFSGWSGDCSSTGNCIVTMSASRNVTATFTLEPSQISGAVPPDGEYGDPYDFQFVSAGQPPLTYSLTGGSLPPGLSLDSGGRLDGTPTAAGVFGPFTVTVASSYDSASKPFTVTIAKAPLQVLATFVVIRQGQTIPNPLPYNFKGFRLGDTRANLQNDVIAFTTTATDSNIVGDYSIDCPDPGPLPVQDDYILACKGNKLQITPKLIPVVTWTPAITQIVYGTPLGAAVLNATATVPGTFTYRVNGDVVDVNTVLPGGNGEVIDLEFVPTDSVNYASVILSRQINVTRAPLTITADNKIMGKDVPLPTLTASYSGFVNGDGPKSLKKGVFLSTTADTSKPGVYPIFVYGGYSSNYQITFVNGQLEVKEIGIYLPLIFK
ncbi:MAG: hypothetical protein BroJett011_74830 [Chloroflexota bacterium]|nr:MAG: hypothetical protein BroJett011_74830 [Chloroflexota bacterium]